MTAVSAEDLSQVLRGYARSGVWQMDLSLKSSVYYLLEVFKAEKNPKSSFSRRPTLPSSRKVVVGSGNSKSRKKSKPRNPKCVPRQGSTSTLSSSWTLSSTAFSSSLSMTHKRLHGFKKRKRKKNQSHPHSRRRMKKEG